MIVSCQGHFPKHRIGVRKLEIPPRGQISINYFASRILWIKKLPVQILDAAKVCLGYAAFEFLPQVFHMTQQTSMGLTEWLMLMLLSILWGGSFFFMKVSLAELPTLTIVFCRVAFAAVTLALVLKLMGQLLPSGFKLWRTFFIMGFINNLVPFSLLVWGMTELSSGLASILNATTPVFTILVAHFATSDERISTNKIIGVVLGLVGVAVLIGVDAVSGFSQSLLAMLACLGASLSYGLAATYGRKFKTMQVKPVSVAFGQVTASSLLLLPVALIADSPWSLALPSLYTWSSLVALGGTIHRAGLRTLFPDIVARWCDEYCPGDLAGAGECDFPRLANIE